MPEASGSDRTPEIVCLQLERQERSRTRLNDIYIFFFTLISCVVGILALPYSLDTRELILTLALILLLALYLAAGEKTEPQRSWLVFKLRKLILRQLLALPQARTEMLSLFYDGAFHPFSRELTREAYVAFRKMNVVTQLREDNLYPKYVPRADFERLRRLTKQQRSWNSVIYRLETINSAGKDLLMVFGPGCYLDYVDTCENIGSETDTLLMHSSFLLLRRRLHLIKAEGLQNSYRALFKHMPLRKLLAAQKDDLLDPTLRCLKMGINNVTLLKDSTNGGYRFLLALRSRKIVEFPDAFHVVPAGTFEPSRKETYYDQKECTPLFTVLRELFEECFVGDKKGEYDMNPYPIEKVLRQKPISQIVDLLAESRKADFRVCGVYIDYYNTKVEMTTCLVIHDEHYLESNRDSFITNWEYATELQRLPFSRSVVDKWINSGQILPIGAIAIRDAVEEFPQLIMPS